ncbi:MAG: hypothetical protein EOM40_16540 [Clostridia bacterium]|nr:hypothetical protein [Clostridia bacterium]NCC44198.1 hypothetical protein [Clostridia bacterium]
MIRKFLHKISLNFSLFVYIILALVPIIFVTLFVIRMTSSMLTKNSQDLVEYQTSHVAELLNKETESLLDVFYSTLTNRTLRSLCSSFDKEDNVEYTTSLLKDELNFYMTLNPNISQCVFVSSDNRYTMVQRYRPATSNTEWKEDDYRKNILDTITSTNSLGIFPSREPDSTYDAAPVFYVGIPLKKSAATYTYGVILLGIQKTYFSSAFFETEDTDSDEMPEILQLTQLILADQDDTVIYASDSEMVGHTLTNYTEKNELTSKDYIITKYNIEKTEWSFYSYCPKNIAFRSVTEGIKLIYILVALYGVFLVYACIMIVSHQNKKIRIIANGIQHFQGHEKGYYIPLFSNENLNIIITQFNLMSNRVSTLTANLKDEQMKSQKEMNLRRKAEIKILEAQINPHFLYNTLDTINWMAISNNEMEISTMIGSLGSLLRYSVTNIDSPVLIKAEIEWIKKYLFLQQKRFHSLFTYDLIIDPAVENYTIYKMLLQPLIENSIIHGFSDITEGGYILVKMWTSKAQIYISITDNGCGLEEEKLSQLRSLAQNPNVYFGDNIGFFNVISRLHAYYKDNFDLFIESKKGTQITILLPKY